MEEKGRHFLLHLLKFVFGVAGRRELPRNTQCWLNRHHPNEKSPFTGKIVSALINYITDYIDHVDDLDEIASQKFRDELKSIAKDEDFLKFVGRYSVKVLAEYCNGDQSSPSLFLGQVTEFLGDILIEEGSVTDFLENWNKAAEKLLKEAEGRSFPRRFDPTFVVDLNKEKSFIVDVMNWAFGIFNGREEIKLKTEDPQSLLTAKIKSALKLIVHHHQQFLSICDYEQLQDYFHKRCVKNFDFKNFIELCVCCVANVTFKNSSLETSEHACDFLLQILETARKENKFISFSEIHDAANDLADIFQALYQQE